jgi:hypothetical protein
MNFLVPAEASRASNDRGTGTSFFAKPVNQRSAENFTVPAIGFVDENHQTFHYNSFSHEYSRNVQEKTLCGLNRL